MAHRNPTFLLVAVLVFASGLATAKAYAKDTRVKDAMKKVSTTSAISEDAKALAPFLSQAKAAVPADPSVDGMAAIFDKAIAAANRGDMAGTKATCKECHTQFRDTYKTKFGSKSP